MAATTPRTSYANVQPAADPSIGLGTKMGYGMGSAALLAAVLDAVIGDSLDADTRTLIISGLATILGTTLGRMYQAGRAYAHKRGVDL